MKLVGSSQQQAQHRFYNFDGTTVNGAKLIVPRSPSRSMLFFVNLHATAAMYLGIGFGQATATITNGAVTGVTINNAGFNYTKPPLLRFHGGGYPQGFSGPAPGPNTSYVGLAHPDQGSSPQNPATARTVLTSNAISSVVITNPGSGYIIAPYVEVLGSDLDPYGCEVPSATYGILVGANGGSFYVNGTACPTDPIAVYCGTNAAPYTCRIMT